MRMPKVPRATPSKPSSKCAHGRQKSRCKECGGASICEHMRRRNICKECKGSQICR